MNKADVISKKEIKEIVINDKAKNGQYKCPNCGASDITFNEEKGKLICNYCNTEFEEKANMNIDLKKLNGTKKSKASHDIDYKNRIVTLKCDSCGAEIIIDTTDDLLAKCHWCGSLLSINQKIGNGLVPDVILPFKVDKKTAIKKMEEYLANKTSDANNKFLEDFKEKNIVGLYLPYMLIDSNVHAKYLGEGEHLIKIHNLDEISSVVNTYDVECYHIEREFDIYIDDLTIESNRDISEKDRIGRTNNIINSIMPFDTENCVEFNANYLKGYASEKRDLNVDEIKNKVKKQIKTITRIGILDDLKYYDRGIRWDKEKVEIKGINYVSCYLPVWIYSYLERKEGIYKIHYIAVNGRTGETSGSIPINKAIIKIEAILISLLITIVPVLLFIYVISKETKYSILIIVPTLCISAAIAYALYCRKIAYYRNDEARHKFEKETKTQLNVTKRVDKKIEIKTELLNPIINECNCYKVDE